MRIFKNYLKSALMTTWRDRLEAAIKESKRSKRSISLGANMGPAYLSQMLKDEKDPTIDSLRKVCDEIGVSLAFIVSGIEISSEDEEILRRYTDLPDRQREAFLDFLRSLGGPESA